MIEYPCSKCGDTPAYKDIVINKNGTWDYVFLCKMHIKENTRKKEKQKEVK